MRREAAGHEVGKTLDAAVGGLIGSEVVGFEGRERGSGPGGSRGPCLRR